MFIHDIPVRSPWNQRKNTGCEVLKNHPHGESNPGPLDWESNLVSPRPPPLNQIHCSFKETGVCIRNAPGMWAVDRMWTVDRPIFNTFCGFSSTEILRIILYVWHFMLLIWYTSCRSVCRYVTATKSTVPYDKKGKKGGIALCPDVTVAYGCDTYNIY